MITIEILVAGLAAALAIAVVAFNFGLSPGTRVALLLLALAAFDLPTLRRNGWL
jgi:hypothetical protein